MDISRKTIMDNSGQDMWIDEVVEVRSYWRRPFPATRKRCFFKDTGIFHLNKVLLSIWCLLESLLWALFSTINFGKYCDQFDKLKDAVIGHHDNAKLCILHRKRKIVTVFVWTFLLSILVPVIKKNSINASPIRNKKASRAILCK